MADLEFNERWRIYEVVVYMAWGDERLAPAEISAARAVAEELQLVAADLAAGSVLRAGPPLLGDVGLPNLSRRGRYVAYAVAAWVAFADGYEHPAERAILQTLRYRMSLPDEIASLLESSAMLVTAQASQVSPRVQLRALLHAIEDVVGSEPMWAEPVAT